MMSQPSTTPRMNAPRPTRAHVRELLQIVRQYGDLVRWVARSQGVHEAALDDVVQDTFLGILRRLPDRDPEVPLRAWVMGVARNAAFSHERGAARYGRRLRALAPREPPTTPEHQVQERQAWSLLRQFIDRLPKEQREVFVLCEIQGEAAPDVARLMGCSVNTVHSRLRLARGRFNERFSDPARARPMIARAKQQAAAEPKANARLVAVVLADLPASSRWGLGFALGGGGAGSWGIGAGLVAAAALVAVVTVRDSSSTGQDEPEPVRASAASAPTAGAGSEPSVASPPVTLAAAPEAAPVVVSAAARAERQSPSGASAGPSARARAEHESSSLAEESALLAQARISLSNGDPRDALEALERHRRLFPDGALSLERHRLQLRSACEAGDTELARVAAVRVAGATAVVVPEEPCDTHW
jgi:RNA polymerase sigma-70 factor (ECF subfamily)